MYRFCRDNGFKQSVKKPTRDNYLLDLVVTDFDEVSEVLVLPQIADHNVVRASFKINVPHVEPRQRQVLAYNDANWPGLRHTFAATD